MVGERILPQAKLPDPDMAEENTDGPNLACSTWLRLADLLAR